MSQAGLQDLAGNNYHVDKMSFKKQHPMLDQTGQVDTFSYCHRPVPTHPLLAFLLSQDSFRSGTVQIPGVKVQKASFHCNSSAEGTSPSCGFQAQRSPGCSIVQLRPAPRTRSTWQTARELRWLNKGVGSSMSSLHIFCWDSCTGLTREDRDTVARWVGHCHSS